MNNTPASNVILSRTEGSGDILYPEYALNQIILFVQDDSHLLRFLAL